MESMKLGGWSQEGVFLLCPCWVHHKYLSTTRRRMLADGLTQTPTQGVSPGVHLPSLGSWPAVLLETALRVRVQF